LSGFATQRQGNAPSAAGGSAAADTNGLMLVERVGERRQCRLGVYPDGQGELAGGEATRGRKEVRPSRAAAR
jgi:hypothetical protein